VHVALRLLELVAWIAAACFSLHAYGSTLLGVLCFTMFNVRCGWIQHEAGHNSFTTNTKMDKFIQTLTVGLGLSTCGYQWNKMHNKHHATPQKVNSDIDLDTLPLVAFFKGALEKNRRKRPVSALWLKLQALTFVPFTCGLVAHFWIYLLHPMNALQRDKLGFLVMALSHILKPAAFVYFGGLSIASSYFMFVICNWLAAVYLFGHFSLSHTFMPEVDEDDHVTW
jgi:fatty acid desaturase 2 (delta-6 desaturase)